MAWRYFAQRLTKSGPAEILDLELPLAQTSLTDVLSGPAQGQANIPVEIARLRDDRGQPLLREWGTAIYAEADGQIRHGGILVRSGFQEQQWRLEWVGFTGYSQGLPYLDASFGVQVDPLDRVRHIWDHIQARHSRLGLHLDGTTSPVRIGTELEQIEFDTQSGPVSFEAGPHKLAWYMTHDLQKEVDDLAKETPFDYSEEHAWNAARTAVEHRMRLWYPRKGRRRHDQRFVLGENLFKPPTVDRDGEQFANAVMGLGAGEGRDMIRSAIVASDADDRLSRVAVVTDKSLRSVKTATDLARRELATRLELDDITSVVVRQHPNANIHALQTGDEVHVQAETGWVDVDLWCRILSRTINPDDGDVAELSLQRVV